MSTKKIFVDRSRYEQFGRCPRSRFLAYHEGAGGMGIDSIRRPLPLCVGASVHVGLAELLRDGQQLVIDYEDESSMGRIEKSYWLQVEDRAVASALADFSQYQSALDLPDAESATLAANPLLARNEVDEYLYLEQSALVESLVRAYARRRLRPLLDQFEVLEVEREGEWLLSEWRANKRKVSTGEEFPRDTHTEWDEMELWFMSRPDALLRERESNALYLLSYKTTGSWDVRKARDAEHDMQGMSEGIEIERRLAEWWGDIRNAGDTGKFDGGDVGCSKSMYDYLSALDAPPRILAVRMEYMLKGERWKDRELSERFGVEMRSQKSHLIRQYVAVSVPMRGTAGYQIGDTCWSWDYIREDGRDGSLAWQNWKSRRVENVKEWIDALDDAAETMSAEDSTMGLEPRLLGYKCDAQAVGVTREHPLDAVFIPPIHIYRNDDELRDLVDQMEAQERRIAEGVAAVHAATDESERRHLLNVHFPMVRRACEYPTTCQFSKGVCFASEDAKRDPLATGLYRIRTANHPQENKNV